VIDFNVDEDSATNTGHAIIAVDIARFVPLPTFTAEVDRHLGDLRGSRLLPGFDAIRLPGERRAACRDERARDGIPVPAPLLAQLDKSDSVNLSRSAKPQLAKSPRSATIGSVIGQLNWDATTWSKRAKN
jgi:LDH2 family malate/lactate/ureidoglycolate dehydrogenase